MGATMKDIARVTGLGLATISSYLNGGNVREKNRIKIEAAIDELDFEVNEVARGLKTNRTKTIGIIIPELNNIFCADCIPPVLRILLCPSGLWIIHRIRSALRGQDFSCFIKYSDFTSACSNINSY